MQMPESSAKLPNTEQKSTAIKTSNQDRARSIGAILVDSGRLRESDIDKIQGLAERTGQRFGEAAIELKLITRQEIELALAKQFRYPVLSHGSLGDVADEVVAAYDSNNAVVEDLRTVRSRLSMGWLQVGQRNILAITSPESGDGRSWLAANLATLFAQAGVRTLLLDAAIRNPRQHQLFHIDNEPGLAELLTGRAGKDIIQRVHEHLRLFVAPAGMTPPNPQELIVGPLFELVLDRFAQQFDLIIVDTPPLTENSDAEIIAARSGAALMITRKNHTRPARLRSALSGLTRAGVKIIGTVLNEH
jgi:chain length determinant protein tyrosine kinase EpsG